MDFLETKKHAVLPNYLALWVGVFEVKRIFYFLRFYVFYKWIFSIDLQVVVCVA